ncbi:4-hydroxy-tetrahydrodipicolinate reductase [Alicyclobacillus cellulosilyticus]|uniref:4-hydroxy-tetrahydrodipicolinate reductase n=1 Tax=Alicyclobacillus cellulosilyticus TaxID=1003997 RepID=A0A917NKD8_9BACL|nr:4-hydroxy-tetrahydrodipicolinate reductase [Alicyclobacillus cellulosilyticus]GGJ07381.1 4-hydroxy-tetrahydrodipicolinate reductase [Alicyclobacillus cellulosilyticus]
MTLGERSIRVLVAGAAGRMGREAVAALAEDGRFHIAGALVRDPGRAPDGLRVFTDPVHAVEEARPDVWLDLTDAESVVRHVDLAISFGVRPVVGATGYGAEDVARWQKACEERGLGGVVAPNFALGALLMIRFAQEAARFYAAAEIVELHHDGKKDAPSGTARRTALLIRDVTGRDVPIHSVRLPGLVAHQEVIFGGTGETLTIRHDSLSRASFMPGIRLACAKVMELSTLVYGLEHLLW